MEAGAVRSVRYELTMTQNVSNLMGSVQPPLTYGFKQIFFLELGSVRLKKQTLFVTH